MDSSVLLLFEKTPQALSIYEASTKRLLKELGPVQVKVQKSQIVFSSRYQFVFIRHPSRRLRDEEDVYMVVAFGISHRIEDSRIEATTESYPDRWTHHVTVQSMGEINDKLIGWIRKAYEFALVKQGSSQSGETEDQMRYTVCPAGDGRISAFLA